MDWSWPALGAIGIALAAGGLTKGVVGIGLPLVAVPLMTLAVAPRTAVVAMAMPILLTNLLQAAASARRRASLEQFWPLMLMIPAGTVAGALVLKTGDPRLVAVVLGVFMVLAAVAMQWQLQWSLPWRVGRRLAPGIGFTAGLIGGVSSFFGPVLILFLAALRLPKEHFVGSIAWMYLVCGLSMVSVFIGLGVVSTAEIALSTAATVPAVAGQWLGTRVRHRIPEAPFRRLVLLMMVIAGLNLLRRGLLS